MACSQPSQKRSVVNSILRNLPKQETRWLKYVIAAVFPEAIAKDRILFRTYCGIEANEYFNVDQLFFYLLTQLDRVRDAEKLAPDLAGNKMVPADKLFLSKSKPSDESLKKLRTLSLRLGLAKVFVKIEKEGGTEVEVLKAELGDPECEKTFCQIFAAMEMSTEIAYGNCKRIEGVLELYNYTTAGNMLQEFFSCTNPFLGIVGPARQDHPNPQDHPHPHQHNPSSFPASHSHTSSDEPAFMPQPGEPFTSDISSTDSSYSGTTSSTSSLHGPFSSDYGDRGFLGGCTVPGGRPARSGRAPFRSYHSAEMHHTSTPVPQLQKRARSFEQGGIRDGNEGDGGRISRFDSTGSCNDGSTTRSGSFNTEQTSQLTEEDDELCTVQPNDSNEPLQSGYESPDVAQNELGTGPEEMVVTSNRVNRTAPGGGTARMVMDSHSATLTSDSNGSSQPQPQPQPFQRHHSNQ